MSRVPVPPRTLLDVCNDIHRGNDALLATHRCRKSALVKTPVKPPQAQSQPSQEVSPPRQASRSVSPLQDEVAEVDILQEIFQTGGHYTFAADLMLNILAEEEQQLVMNEPSDTAAAGGHDIVLEGTPAVYAKEWSTLSSADLAYLLQVQIFVTRLRTFSRNDSWMRMMMNRLDDQMSMYSSEEVERVLHDYGLRSPHWEGAPLDIPRYDVFVHLFESLKDSQFPLCPMTGALWQVILAQTIILPRAQEEVPIPTSEGCLASQVKSVVTPKALSPLRSAPRVDPANSLATTQLDPEETQVLDAGRMAFPSVLLSCCVQSLKCSTIARHRFLLVLRRMEGLTQADAEHVLSSVSEILASASAGEWSPATFTEKMPSARPSVLAALRAAASIHVRWSPWADAVLATALS